MMDAARLLHRIVHGSTGPPVLLLHGLGSRAADWMPQIQVLAPQHHVLAVDLPGHGASPLPPGSLTIETMADATAAVAAAVCTAPVPSSASPVKLVSIR